jgi:hypothetical protein
MECEWCKNMCDGSLIANVEGIGYKVCATCLNLLAIKDYDTLNDRIKSAPQNCEIKDG